jgi:predicted kinase
VTETEGLPQVHVLCGLAAAGKTTLAKSLAKELPALRLSRDEWMLRLYGLPYDDPRYVAALEPCSNLMWDVATDVLALGTSVVLDWNHWSRQRRADAKARASQAGVQVVVHYLDVPLETALERARERRSSPSGYFHTIDDDGVRQTSAIIEAPAPSEGMRIVRHS